jgi:small subunit ribosomal protein S8
MINDVISDMLTRIRNANIVQHLTVQVLSTKLTKQIAEILWKEGYIKSWKISDNCNYLVLELWVKAKEKRIKIVRVSKPGLRVYKRAKNLPKILGGVGSAIITTSKGLMTDSQARKENLGGEVLFYIW